MGEQQTLAMAAGFEKHAKPAGGGRSFLRRGTRWFRGVSWWRRSSGFIPGTKARAGSGWSACCGCTLQHWFNVSDPGVEEAVYESLRMRHFVSIDLGSEPVPDGTTVCKFRHLLERHGPGAKIFSRVNGYLESRRVRSARYASTRH